MADMTACLQAADFEDVVWIERFSSLEAMRYDTPTIDNVCLARHACDDTHAAPPPVLDRQMMRPARQHVALTAGYIRETRTTTSFSSCNSRVSFSKLSGGDPDTLFGGVENTMQGFSH